MIRAFLFAVAFLFAGCAHAQELGPTLNQPGRILTGGGSAGGGVQSAPTLSQTFDQAIAGMGIATPAVDYVFGTSCVAAAGQTCITGLGSGAGPHDLGTYFNACEDSCSGGTINSELEYYPQAFTSANTAFTTNQVTLTALIDTTTYANGYTTIRGTASGGGITPDGSTANPIANFGLTTTTGLSVGQVWGAKGLSGIYYITAITAGGVGTGTVTLTKLGNGSPITTYSSANLNVFYPYYVGASSGTVSFGATTVTFTSLPASVGNGSMIAAVTNTHTITRNNDYRITNISSNTVTISPSLHSEMTGSAGQLYIMGPPITSGEFWSNTYYNYVTNGKPIAFDAWVVLPTDSSGGYNIRGVSTVSAYNAVPSNTPWGVWPAFWTFSGTNDVCPSCPARDSSEADFIEMFWGTTTGPWMWSSNDHTGAGSVIYANITYQNSTGWSNSPGFGFLLNNSASIVGLHRASEIIVPNVATYSYLDGVLMQVWTWGWTSAHQGQFGFDLAMGAFANSNVSNLQTPFDAANFPQATFSVREVTVYHN